MIIAAEAHHSNGQPRWYEIEAHDNEARFKVTVSRLTKIQRLRMDGSPNVDTKIEWTECEYWTYEDILRIQKLLLVAVDRIKEDKKEKPTPLRSCPEQTIS